MAKTGQNFSLFKGESKLLAIVVTNTDGTPYVLTGKRLLYRVAKNPQSKVDMLQQTEQDIVVTGTGANIANIQFQHDDTDQKRAGQFYHELRVFDDALDVEIVVMTGNWTLKDSITNIITP